MFRRLLTGTMGTVLGLSLGIAGVAWWSSAESAYQFERLRLSQEVRAEYLRLAALSASLLREVTLAGAEFTAEPAQLRLNQQFDALRRVNLAEVALLPEDPGEIEEMHELAAMELAAHAALDRLARAAAALRREGSRAAQARFEAAVTEGFGTAFRDSLANAIRREEAQAVTTEREALAALGIAGHVARIGAAALVVVVAATLFLLFGRLQRPLNGLARAAQAVAAGDLSQRIPPEAAGGEFAHVAASFNAMVEEIARSRAALERARDELEQAVEARTAELAAANAELKRGDETRRRFLADVSHELRTPLTVMRGEAEIALRAADRPAEDYRKALTRIAEEARLTARLVDDLLFVARSEAGEARLAAQAVAFDEVVRGAAAAARILAAPRQVRVTEQVAGRSVTVRGDPERLRQLVLILLDNAVRYSDPGGEVQVSLEPAPEGIRLCVRDTGMGIAPAEIERVFERFYRGHGAAARHASGSGLGLPLARAIARAHGGEVLIESRPGEGSTARLILPAVRRLQLVGR